MLTLTTMKFHGTILVETTMWLQVVLEIRYATADIEHFLKPY